MKEIDVSSLQSQFPDSWLIVWVRQWDENDNIPVSGSLIAKSTSRDRAEAALKTAKELAPDIRVNAIAPGYILTEINDDFFATEAGQNYVKNIPMNRLGLESDLDGVLLLLASDASAFMTGSIIPVDGGHLINPL